ncbi:RNA-directed DNA polymerase, eukaryota, reverse transcriptase zinc-binding domain protein [Tanacetum coccineum]
MDTTDMRNVILVKVRDVHLILNINNVLRKEGFYDFQSKYIGGMWLWIEFDTTESCQKLQSNKEMSWYFTQMKHVTQSFKVDERVVWIKIGGLPLNAWTPKAYKKIACNWGEPLFVDEDPHDNVAMGRVCIRTKIQGQIIETCKVVIHGQSHNVRVKEFAGWVPDIEAMDSLSSKNSDMGISYNHDDVNSDNSAQDVEEGEIRGTNEVHEENDVNNHHFSWADDAVNIVKDYDDSSTRNQPIESQKQHPTKTSETQKPYRNPLAKSSRASKSHSKSFSNKGSMIEAFISHIENGKSLGIRHGRSDGLVSVWDPNAFTKLIVFPSENLLIVEGNWISTHMHCYMVNVYAPQDDKKKEILWHNILDFKEGNPGHYLIFGDFNVVRFASERIGTIFNSASANVFNQFIRDGHLWEIPHGGHLFTRINRRGDKLSKLDRFLITENSASHMHNYSAQVLDCHISDHRTIILSASSLDFGPIPFKFYNSWLLEKQLHTIVTEFWEQHVAEIGSNSIVGFKTKMKALKTIVKEWSRNRTSSQSREKDDMINKIKEFDAATVRGSDENSKFFHAIVNQKRRTFSIHGIKHEGHWLSDPQTIKDAFHSFFESKFKKVDVVMCFMGFSEKWITWIKGCLYSAKSSILVNGSPTREFHINRGLHQGDPLSPFLFNIVMESIHVAVEDAISNGLYQGLKVNTMTLSHFFFADDALILGEWSRANIKSMASILECFNRVSGLKINFHKSNLAGVGVPFKEVKHFAQIT